jgi:chromate reductase, NAD(P)H dehydrogenase (quinone)
MRKFKVAIVVGSNRRESINRKLAQAIAKLAEIRADASWSRSGTCRCTIKTWRARCRRAWCASRPIEQADALLFVTLEHNRSLPAVLKNAIDWGARPYGRNSWVGKPAVITGTSSGDLGDALPLPCSNCQSDDPIHQLT